MRQRNGKPLPTDLAEIADLLREERPEASPLELDRIKTRAMGKAAEGASVRVKGPNMKPRVVSILIVAGVLVGGTGGVMAATGGIPGSGQSSSSATKAQYCPPTSNNPGSPKHPQSGKSCGKQQ